MLFHNDVLLSVHEQSVWQVVVSVFSSGFNEASAKTRHFDETQFVCLLVGMTVFYSHFHANFYKALNTFTMSVDYTI